MVLPAPVGGADAGASTRSGRSALGLAIVGVSVVLSEGGGWGWTSARIARPSWRSAWWSWRVWVRHELRQDDPLVDLRQVRNRSVLTADISGFLICVAMYLFLPIVVEFVQVPAVDGYGFGASVVVSSLVFLPLSVGHLRRQPVPRWPTSGASGRGP